MILEVNEVLESYENYLTNISSGILKLAEYFRDDQLEKGLKGILDFSEGLTWLTLSNEFLVDNNKVKKEDFSSIVEYLEEINTGLELQDYILVADILEYEIATYFEKIYTQM